MNDENFPGGSQAVTRIDGAKIRLIRERKELTQLYVATVVGVTTDTISRWENRRYPTIKQENALKLAEVLEVDLADILDDETLGKSSDDTGMPTAGKEGNKGLKNRPLSYMVVVVAMALFFALVMFFKPQKLNESAPLIITAQRVLPAHVAPGQFFPVLVRVDITPAGMYSMIVREIVPHDCLVVKGLPSFANFDQKSGVLKWIGKTNKQTSFSYLARVDSSILVGKQLSFQGLVTLKSGNGSTQVQIYGNESLTVEKLHWADGNGDYRIDDEEILAIYEQLETMTELGAGDLQSKVEDIWAASGYRWDETAGNFLIVP